jgi:hypothetical protein
MWATMRKLEPLRCQSIEPLGVLMGRRIRCEREDHHEGPHKCGNRTWEVKEPFSTMDHMKRIRGDWRVKG